MPTKLEEYTTAQVRVEGSFENGSQSLTYKGRVLVKAHCANSKRYFMIPLDDKSNLFGFTLVVGERELTEATEVTDVGHDIRKWHPRLVRAFFHAERQALNKSQRQLNDIPFNTRKTASKNTKFNSKRIDTYEGLDSSGLIRKGGFLRGRSHLSRKRVLPPFISPSRTVKKRRQRKTQRLEGRSGAKKRITKKAQQIKHLTLRDFTIFVGRKLDPVKESNKVIVPKPADWPEEAVIGDPNQGQHYLIQQLAFSGSVNANGLTYREFFTQQKDLLGEAHQCLDCTLQRYCNWWSGISKRTFLATYALNAGGYLINVSTHDSPEALLPPRWPIKTIRRIGSKHEIRAFRGFINRNGITFREWFSRNKRLLKVLTPPQIYRRWWEG